MMEPQLGDCGEEDSHGVVVISADLVIKGWNAMTEGWVGE
jgi:hypothetical protein